jgi:hypothetical protein
MARTFAEITKERDNPITDPSTYEYGQQGARRARTFSQVIAEATRGVDAGMNRFTEQPADLSSDRYAPDWRGHYLGADGLVKRDFAAVLKDVREAIKGAVPGVPHPHSGTGRRQNLTTNPKDAQPLRTSRLPRATGWAHKGDFAFDIPVAKLVADKNQVFGWASIIEEAGVPVVDTQNDVITEEDLENAFYGFAKDYGQGGEMHDRTDAGEMIECMVFTKEKQQALGINLGKIGAWVGFEFEPAVFAKFKSGEYTGFSIGGTGRRIEIGEAD